MFLHNRQSSIRDNSYHPVPLSRNLGTLTSRNPLGHSGPVRGVIIFIRLPTSSFLVTKLHVIYTSWVRNLLLSGDYSCTVGYVMITSKYAYSFLELVN